MKGQFSLSYYDFDGLNDMYPKDQYKWETKEFVKASGAKAGESQSIGEEVLIMNYWASSKLNNAIADTGNPNDIGRNGDKNRGEKK